MSPTHAADAKMALRRAVLERRRAAHMADAERSAQAVAQLVLSELDPKGTAIGGYWPLGEELDSRPALEALALAGATMVLPVVAGQGQVLIFRAWAPGDSLDSGPFGTMHPGTQAQIIRPRVILVPLIAFDLDGGRLGYGAGYYDRTIAAFRADGQVTAIGLAYDAQRVDTVPTDPHDQPLDAVITPSGILWFSE